MNINLDLAYTVKLSHAELRVIGLALSGRKLNQEEQREALALNERLCDLRAKQLEEAAEIARGAHRTAADVLATLTDK
jgi:hypothetical protein